MKPIRPLFNLLPRRGLVLALFCLSLILWLALDRADILAAVFANCVLVLLALLAIANLAQAARLRRQVTVSLEAFAADANYSGTTWIAQVPNTLLIKLPALRVLPFFRLSLELKFVKQRYQGQLHQLKGLFDAGQNIFESITFPHRGNWELCGVEFSVTDRLGLTQRIWQDSSVAGFVIPVAPPAGESSTHPIISSASRAGDELPDIQARHGEDFDLKPYHPSDGTRKILWKVYAKSLQLISRHPERSLTPEGRSAVFCLAATEEDDVCAEALAYVKKLEDLDLQISFGCLGMDSNLAHSYGTAKELLIASAWEALDLRQAPISAASFVKGLKVLAPQSNIERVVIFSSEAQLEAKEARACLAEFENVGITPVLITKARRGKRLDSGASGLWRRAARRFVALLWQREAGPSWT